MLGSNDTLAASAATSDGIIDNCLQVLVVKKVGRDPNQ